MTGSAVMAIPQSDIGFWKAAYEDHGPAVMAFLRSRLGNPEDAEELMQETFVRAMRTSERLRDRGSVRSYLFTTAHNLMRNWTRRREVSPIVNAVPELSATSDEATDTRARLRALMERLAEVLEELSPAHREAFKLGVLDRLPYRDIARMTGTSEAAVKVNVYRARKQVIGALTDFVPGSSEVKS